MREAGDAYGVGGSLETVRGAWRALDATDETTGTYFDEQTPAGVEEAMQRWETSMERTFDPKAAEMGGALCDTTLPGTIPRLCSKQGAGSG